MNLPAWVQEECGAAASWKQLADAAKRSIEGKSGLYIVCGPLTSGGTGLEELNFTIFNACIRALERRNYPVFDQLPYETDIRRLTALWHEEGNDGYCHPVLNEFYYPLFETRAFKTGCFIPGWPTSTGAGKEFRKLASLGCDLFEFRLAQIREFLLEAGIPLARVDRIMRLLPPPS